MSFARFVAGRLAGAIMVLVVVAALVFVAVELLPGDAVRARLGPEATAAQVEAERDRLGLDRPGAERFAGWLAGALGGDLGVSTSSGRPVVELVGPAAASSLALAAAVLALLVPLALGLGVACGRRPGGRLDRAALACSMLLGAVPMFATGVLLALVFAVWLGWLPALSLLDPGRPVLAQPQTLVLPTVTVVAGSLAYAARVVRGGAVEAFAAPHVEAARLRGVPERIVVWRHTVPGLAPVALQALALVAAALVTGLVVVEVVFAYPGLGALLQTSVAGRDGPVVVAVTVLGAGAVLLANLVADVATRVLVPRLRTAG